MLSEAHLLADADASDSDEQINSRTEIKSMINHFQWSKLKQLHFGEINK